MPQRHAGRGRQLGEGAQRADGRHVQLRVDRPVVEDARQRLHRGLLVGAHGRVLQPRGRRHAKLRAGRVQQPHEQRLRLGPLLAEVPDEPHDDAVDAGVLLGHLGQKGGEDALGDGLKRLRALVAQADARRGAQQHGEGLAPRGRAHRLGQPLHLIRRLGADAGHGRRGVLPLGRVGPGREDEREQGGHGLPRLSAIAAHFPQGPAPGVRVRAAQVLHQLPHPRVPRPGVVGELGPRHVQVLKVGDEADGTAVLGQPPPRGLGAGVARGAGAPARREDDDVGPGGRIHRQRGAGPGRRAGRGRGFEEGRGGLRGLLHRVRVEEGQHVGRGRGAMEGAGTRHLRALLSPGSQLPPGGTGVLELNHRHGHELTGLRGAGPARVQDAEQDRVAARCHGAGEGLAVVQREQDEQVRFGDGARGQTQRMTRHHPAAGQHQGSRVMCGYPDRLAMIQQDPPAIECCQQIIPAGVYAGQAHCNRW
ncbi:melanocortin 1 receptor [Stigmatella aurantiaca DW4/3-1]|uniref:Melanocortin 1 receptor n=1 Tax=Stigmatella aurantiaca (strain DW4/3-1) TaxID=378806 RepID=Q08S73_STIAD|nr:melanocortin 1 receptor [Stigmatella aurantiaca DW4/3-1]